MVDSPTDFARETWSLYGVGLFLVVLRYIARIRRFGIKNLQFDDYMMFNGIIWYTIMCVAFNRVMSGGGSNFMTEEETLALTPESIKDRIVGSKWVFVTEHSMLLAIWSMKACMLHLYASITEGLPQRKYVNYVAVYTVASFVGCEIALFTACTPTSQYWAVPPQNGTYLSSSSSPSSLTTNTNPSLPVQCASYQFFEIIQGCLNIPGDIAMLTIGIPILASIRLPTQQKAILLIIFGMGFFIIVAAILTKIYCLVPGLISYVYMNWYFREASVAVYVTNLPTIWPLLREIFPAMQTWGSSKTKVTSNMMSGSKAWGAAGGGSSKVRIGSRDFHMSSMQKGGMRAESQERINGDSDSGENQEGRIEIQRDVTFEMKTETIATGDEEQARNGWKRNDIKTSVRGR
ncbi:hypothetical protein ONS95_007459 [Cadophora gregata]|uniref:uncharacterized protein n=1 Tax=Cadophora gregata TaxID=51156 RepID=UPI0026DD4AF0|nr:uncharacterized protein ONS95_007459 [Cadophora gregata]KAK0118573.1 hypothetical protein ONS96_011665 [Cadophora gregata f. sp. sojae]KAK0125828.1 hypothetical protein ONS95_007459 [Cadophora gregata]